MLRFLASRKTALSAADHAAEQMILSHGGPAAMVQVRRDLRWLDPGETDRERKLILLLRALEKRLGYQPSGEAVPARMLAGIM